MAEFLTDHIILVIAILVIIASATIITFVVRAASMYWQDVWPEDLPAPLKIILKGRKDDDEEQ